MRILKILPFLTYDSSRNLWIKLNGCCKSTWHVCLTVWCRGKWLFFPSLCLEIRLGVYICFLNTDLVRIYEKLSLAQKSRRTQDAFLLLNSIAIITNSPVYAYELLTAVLLCFVLKLSLTSFAGILHALGNNN